MVTISLEIALSWLCNWTSLIMPVFPKSRQHVCFVRRRIQMSDIGFVKIISIWCLSVKFGRRSMKSIREDCMLMINQHWLVMAVRQQPITWANVHPEPTMLTGRHSIPYPQDEIWGVFWRYFRYNCSHHAIIKVNDIVLNSTLGGTSFTYFYRQHKYVVPTSDVISPN